MLKIYFLSAMTSLALVCSAQVDKTELALKVNQAEESNLAKLKTYIWKRTSVVSIDGQTKLTTLSEFKFDEKGELKVQPIDAETTVKQKPGLRGAAQKNAVEDKVHYVEKALSIALNYTFMSKGQLIDFFDKATIVQTGDSYTVSGENIYMQGDKLVLQIDAKTHLIVKKTFSSYVDKDAMSGEISYEAFSNGVVHATNTTLGLPAQRMVIVSKNQDYTVRAQ
jgi:hypothetical protein